MTTGGGSAPGLDGLVEFLVELDRLKAVERRIRPIGLERFENSAEHSWSVCLLALALAPHAAETVDLARVIEILLVHDVPEIDCGDQFVYTRDPVAAAAAEAVAAERIFDLAPAPLGARLFERWREYEDRTTPEARLAFAADRLMPVLQNLRGGGRSWREHDVPYERVRALVEDALAATCPAVWKVIAPEIAAHFGARTLSSSEEDS